MFHLGCHFRLQKGTLTQSYYFNVNFDNLLHVRFVSLLFTFHMYVFLNLNFPQTSNKFNS